MNPETEKQIRDIISQELNKYPRLKRKKEGTGIKPPDSFDKWFANLTNKTKGIYSTIIAIPWLAFIFGLVLKILPPNQIMWNPLKIEWILMGLVFLQAVVILVLYWLIPQPPELTEEIIDRIKRRLKSKGKNRTTDFDPTTFLNAHYVSKDFSNMWGYAWLMWAALYLAWGFIILGTMASQEQLFTNGGTIGVLEKFSALTSFINNLSIIFLVICYRELAYPTKPRRPELRRLGSLWATVIVCAAIFDAFAVNFHQFYLIHPILGWLGSFTAGAVIALLIGRLESRFINPPVYITAILYVYAAIQGAFVLFPQDPPLMLTLTSLAFVFKIVFFLLMAWLIGSGVLTFYLAELRIIHETIPEVKTDFISAIHNIEEQKIQKPQEESA
jgi:hypothetical protein